jgi:hypothetical protein
MRTKISLLVIMAGIILVFSCKKETQNSGSIGSGDYVVFAWNDLGMHCLNPTYDEMVILPPYNTVNVQVLKRGNPPTVVTSGITVEYSLVNNTSSYGKRAYGGFWTYYTALFGGTPPAHDIGLTGTGLSGVMTLNTDHFTALGMPVVPVNDAGVWDPFQVININVKDATGNIIATTQATVPTSDEINCAKCHTGGGVSVFTNILMKHDAAHGTTLVDQKPVLCAKCHGSPALGTTGPGSSGVYFSQAIHGFHATKNAVCYDCHPGTTTKCSRSNAHMGTSGDGNCVTCHGDMANVASTIKTGGRVPWVNEPKCVSCHTGVDGVETNTVLYRNSKGHGNVYCPACHGSPHAMFPSREAKDNYQPNQYQGSKIKSIGSCGVCHGDSRGEGSGGEFNSTHGGTNPETKNACHVCHTAISSNTASWPHAYTWKNTN